MVVSGLEIRVGQDKITGITTDPVPESQGRLGMCEEDLARPDTKRLAEQIGALGDRDDAVRRAQGPLNRSAVVGKSVTGRTEVTNRSSVGFC